MQVEGASFTSMTPLSVVEMHSTLSAFTETIVKYLLIQVTHDPALL